MVLGVVEATALIYAGGFISSTINFFIARKLGRKWVAKLAGEKGLEKIDGLLAVSDVSKALILTRVFCFSLFDFISYAAGFTNISFKKYFVISVVFPIIPLSIIAFAFRDFDFTKANSFITWASILLLVSVIFSFYVKKYLYKGRNTK